MKVKSYKPEVLNLKHIGKEKEKGRFKLPLIEKKSFFENQRAKSFQYSSPFLIFKFFSYEKLKA